MTRPLYWLACAMLAASFLAQLGCTRAPTADPMPVNRCGSDSDCAARFGGDGSPGVDR